MLHPRIKSLKKLFQLLMVICGCLHLTGGPYALVQSYAWISMIIQYSKDDGLAKGVKGSRRRRAELRFHRPNLYRPPRESKGKSVDFVSF